MTDTGGSAPTSGIGAKPQKMRISRRQIGSRGYRGRIRISASIARTTSARQISAGASKKTDHYLTLGANDVKATIRQSAMVRRSYIANYWDRIRWGFKRSTRKPGRRSMPIELTERIRTLAVGIVPPSARQWERDTYSAPRPKRSQRATYGD